MEHFFQQHIEKLKTLGRFRSLKISDPNAIDFFSNDYLGLARKEFQLPHNPSGSTGSRLISGNNNTVVQLEQDFARDFGFNAALSFPSGYQANIGLFSALGQKNTTFIYDEYIHASIIDGMRLSFAQRKKFKHNDIADLKKQLERVDGVKIVVIEGRYSMDGDLAPLSEIIKLREQYAFEIIVDEAHSLGTLKSDFRGVVSSLKAQKDILATVFTFGKSIGQHGAMICGSAHLATFLINEARSFIFSTAISPREAIELGMRIEHLKSHYTSLYQELEQNIVYFLSESKKLQHFKANINSPIQFYICGSNDSAVNLALQLEQENINCKAIRYPTVPKGKEGVRIVLHQYNTSREIDHLIQTILDYEKVFH